MSSTAIDPALLEKPLRLFFALWPDDEVRDGLRRFTSRIARRIHGRRVHPANIHLTTNFLGTVDPGTRRCLEVAADGVRAAPFTLLLDQVGFWERPRVVWMGAGETPEALASLYQQLQQAIAGCGLTPERRPLVPHVTLMRRAGRAPVVREFTPQTWHVDAFSLVASVTLPEGARYQILRRWPLG